MILKIQQLVARENCPTGEKNVTVGELKERFWEVVLLEIFSVINLDNHLEIGRIAES